jgi:acetolactate synthase-1/3 small subunit
VKAMKDQKTYTISAFTENSPGVLHRLVTTFTKRKLNIESLTVSETEQRGISRFTIVVIVDEDLIQTIIKQILRIVEVKDAYASLDEELIYKEISFIRVKTESSAERFKVEKHAKRYGAHVVYVEQESMVLEVTGSSSEIRSFYCIMEQYGVTEFIQSGRIAIRK